MRAVAGQAVDLVLVELTLCLVLQSAGCMYRSGLLARSTDLCEDSRSCTFAIIAGCLLLGSHQYTHCFSPVDGQTLLPVAMSVPGN